MRGLLLLRASGGVAGAIGAKYAMNSKVLAPTERIEALPVGRDANAARVATSRGDAVQEAPPLAPTPPPQFPSTPAFEPIPIYGGGRNARQDAARRWQYVGDGFAPQRRPADNYTFEGILNSAKNLSLLGVND